MAGHAGLHRVVKTVKSKKGSAHRAYWVKNDAGPAAHPGIVHRAAVFAGKAALAATAVAATAYLAHKAGSHLAAHAGGGAGRGVVSHAKLAAGNTMTAGISRIAAFGAAHGVHNSANTVSNHITDMINTRKAASHAAHTHSVDASNIQKAAAYVARVNTPSHPGIVRRSSRKGS